jgi:hypothetical protein
MRNRLGGFGMEIVADEGLHPARLLLEWNRHVPNSEYCLQCITSCPMSAIPAFERGS